MVDFEPVSFYIDAIGDSCYPLRSLTNLSGKVYLVEVQKGFFERCKDKLPSLHVDSESVVCWRTIRVYYICIYIFFFWTKTFQIHKSLEGYWWYTRCEPALFSQEQSSLGLKRGCGVPLPMYWGRMDKTMSIQNVLKFVYTPEDGCLEDKPFLLGFGLCARAMFTFREHILWIRTPSLENMRWAIWNDLIWNFDTRVVSVHKKKLTYWSQLDLYNIV